MRAARIELPDSGGVLFLSEGCGTLRNAGAITGNFGLGMFRTAVGYAGFSVFYKLLYGPDNRRRRDTNIHASMSSP